jgi:hypothetical protein
MPASRSVPRLVAALGLGLITGVGLAYWQPRWPLLGYWLLLSISLGVAVSTSASLAGLGRRAKWLLAINAAIVAFALATTQIAARRAISSTHLEYRGVHLVGVDSFTVGAGEADADVRLQSVASAAPWSVRIAKQGRTWTVEPRAGIEQLRVGPVGGSRAAHRFNVAQSTILSSSDDWVAIVDPSGAVVDTLRLSATGVRSATSNAFLLRPVNGDIAARYRRQLRAGVALSSLDGQRTAPSAYERFVRVQELSSSDDVNGVAPSPVQRLAWSLPFVPERLLPTRPLLVAASPPFMLRGAGLDTGLLSFTDSARVEIRSGDVSWDFELRARRREPSADVGLDLLFVRNPRALDTPLPTGVSCRAGVACGAISLRRLPPPVAHVALDFAGFDPNRFGMLGKVKQDDDGFTVVLARDVYRVERGAPRPVAIPVTSLAEMTTNAREVRAPNHYWLLLSASGTFGDDMPTIAFIGIGLALVLAAIYTGVQASMPDASPVSREDERWLSLGVAAILALLLTRVIIGARVAFFAPFLRRSIETAVGMWVAIAIVAVGLLSWSAWMPLLLTGARNALAGQIALRRLLIALVRSPLTLWQVSTSSRARVPATLTVVALLLLGRATPAAVANGVIAGVVVLLAWVCLAWVTAFAGYYFETFERGAWSVVEQLAPRNRLSASTTQSSPAGWRARLDAWTNRVPELPIIAACFAAELALLPRLTPAVTTVALMILIATPFVVRRRRASVEMPALPDYWGALVGAAVFTLVLGTLRLQSENGSMAAFVLIVFVALASVRIGRGVGSRIENSERRTPETRAEWGDVLTSSALLVAPLALLAPLMVIDMGLFLVVVVPVGFATLLAAGRRVAGWRLAIPGFAFLVLFGVLAPRILFPSVQGIRNADSHATQATQFARMTQLFGVRLPLVSTSMDRVAARSVATTDRALAEQLLISAKPGQARDLLIPSIEQIWGGTTYASAGFWGGGLGQAVVGGRGVAEPVSYAENTFSVFVLAEHGAFGGVLVLALYLLLTIAVGSTAMAGSAEAPAAYRASRALFLVATLIIAIPAAYVALSNLGVVPITGQNMPFLGLNAWSDVAVCAGVVGILITGAIRRAHELAR